MCMLQQGISFDLLAGPCFHNKERESKHGQGAVAAPKHVSLCHQCCNSCCSRAHYDAALQQTWVQGSHPCVCHITKAGTGVLGRVQVPFGIEVLLQGTGEWCWRRTGCCPSSMLLAALTLLQKTALTSDKGAVHALCSKGFRAPVLQGT